MRRRILLAILSISALAIALFALPLVFVTERFVDENATLRLERQAILAARSVPDDYRASNDAVELVSSGSTHLALYDPDGARVSGVGPGKADATTLAALRNRVGDTESERARIVAVPVTVNEKVIGAIRAEQATSATNQRAWRVAGLVAALAAAVLGIGAAVAFFVAGRLARPIRRLSDAAVQLGEGDFEVDLPRARSRRSTTPTARSRPPRTTSTSSSAGSGRSAPTRPTSSAPRWPGCGRRSRRSWSSPGRPRARAPGGARRHRPVGGDDHGAARAGPPVALVRGHEPDGGAARGRAGVARPPGGPGPAADRRRRVPAAGPGPAGRPTPRHQHPRRQRRPPRPGCRAHRGRGRSGDGHDLGQRRRAGLPRRLRARPRAPDEAGDGLHGVGLPLARRLVTSMPGRLVFVRLRPRPRIDIVVTAVDAPRRPSRPCHRRRRSSARPRADQRRRLGRSPAVGRDLEVSRGPPARRWAPARS